VPDVDDYAASLAAGEALNVSVSANKGSVLLPLLELIDPDGVVTAPAVTEAKAGAKVTLKAFAITKTGRWGVRVSGKNATEGSYTVVFAVKAAKPTVVSGIHLGGSDPTTFDLAFDGLDGAIASIKVKGSPKQPQIHMGTLRDPSSAQVLLPTPAEKKGSVSVSNVTLHTGDGRYLLRLFIDSGEATCTATVKAVPQGRPKSKKPVVLAAGEPVLDPRDTPILGAASGRVHLTGSGFAGAQPPNVYFGRNAGGAVIVGGGGTTIDVTAPVGVNGSTVSVAVVGSDGQSSVRDAYFHYVPPPTATDLKNAAGLQIRGGTGDGGQALILIGTGFEAGQTVSFGTRNATDVVAVDPQHITLKTPPGATGVVAVALHDLYGRSIELPFLFEYKAPPLFGNPAYTPNFGPIAGGVTVTINGTRFEAADRLRINGTDVTSTFVNTSKRTFLSPALPAGSYTLELVDRFEYPVKGPDFLIKAAPVVTGAQAIGGPHVGNTGIGVGGGALVRLTGTDFNASDVVTLAGNPGTTVAATVTPTQLDFIAPAGTPGNVNLTITDAAGQTSSLSNALRYVGYTDATSSHSPGKSGTDDLTATRGAIADLDGDGKADDVVIVSDTSSSPGSRTEHTRLFLGQNNALVDKTSTNFPASFSDSFGVDDWSARAVAIGDLDTSSGKDIVIAGTPTSASYGYYTYYYYYYYYYSYYVYTTQYVDEARVFTNSGQGAFTLSSASPAVRTDPVTCTDGTGGTFSWFLPSYPNGDNATAIAIGDLDGDGKNDIVTSGDHYRFGTVTIPPQYVSHSSGSYVDSNASSHYQYYGTQYYAPAARLFQNRGASGFVDATFPRIPLGDSTGAASSRPVFHGRDVKIGDVDLDGDQDIVIAWDDPTTVTGYGMAAGSGSDTPRVATRVLLNDGSGFFTDATGSWLPAASSPEFWQADRMLLTDLDADGDLDLILLLKDSKDAFLGPPTYGSSALRILRNDRSPTGFVDVTSSALQSIPITGTQDDNLRGTALLLHDVDADGKPDLLIGTTEALLLPNGQPAPRTRVLKRGSGITFTFASGFLPPTSSDTGEAEEFLVGDLSGGLDPQLILLTESTPQTSASGESLRVFRWNR
jgi:IPT/TIG domain-containing protein